MAAPPAIAPTQDGASGIAIGLRVRVPHLLPVVGWGAVGVVAGFESVPGINGESREFVRVRLDGGVEVLARVVIAETPAPSDLPATPPCPSPIDPSGELSTAQIRPA